MVSMSDHKNSVVIITGAAGGLGKNLAKYFIANGYSKLALVSRSKNEELEEIVSSSGLEISRHIFNAELTDETQVKNMVTKVEESLGPVYGLINLAGGSTNGLSWKLPVEEFSQIINNNLVSTFLCCKSVIPFMRDRSSGRIINISSIVAKMGVVGASHYAAAKAGIIGFSKSLSLELAPKSITVNTINLGYFNCGLIDHVSHDLQENIKAQIPLKRLGVPNELGTMLNYLLSNGAEYLTGQDLDLNGGLY